HRRCLRHRGRVRLDPAHLVQDHQAHVWRRPPRFSDVADPSSFRAQGLEGKHRDRSFLDRVRDVRPARARHFETSLNVSYATHSMPVRGAGESGEAAAHLLVEEAAMITVLDTAEVEKLRKKIDTLGASGI